MYESDKEREREGTHAQIIRHVHAARKRLARECMCAHNALYTKTDLILLSLFFSLLASFIDRSCVALFSLSLSLSTHDLNSSPRTRAFVLLFTLLSLRRYTCRIFALYIALSSSYSVFSQRSSSALRTCSTFFPGGSFSAYASKFQQSHVILSDDFLYYFFFYLLRINLLEVFICLLPDSYNIYLEFVYKYNNLIFIYLENRKYFIPIQY